MHAGSLNPERACCSEGLSFFALPCRILRRYGRHGPGKVAHKEKFFFLRGRTRRSSSLGLGSSRRSCSWAGSAMGQTGGTN